MEICNPRSTERQNRDRSRRAQRPPFRPHTQRTLDGVAPFESLNRGPENTHEAPKREETKTNMEEQLTGEFVYDPGEQHEPRTKAGRHESVGRWGAAKVDSSCPWPRHIAGGRLRCCCRARGLARGPRPARGLFSPPSNTTNVNNSIIQP